MNNKMPKIMLKTEWMKTTRKTFEESERRGRNRSIMASLVTDDDDNDTDHYKKPHKNIFGYLFFYVLLTVYLSITLVNDQLDAQLLCFIIRLLQSSTCFEQRCAHHQEVKLY